jgi:hypothetical protein
MTPEFRALHPPLNRLLAAIAAPAGPVTLRSSPISPLCPGPDPQWIEDRFWVPALTATPASYSADSVLTALDAAVDLDVRLRRPAAPPAIAHPRAEAAARAFLAEITAALPSPGLPAD